jgi:branched-chain amino acid transport system ATP-binding protein
LGFSDAMLLGVEGLEKRFGGILALTDYGIEIRKGELVGLIGPNGAGKTTVFNLVSGVLKSTRGRIVFAGKDITHSRPDQNASLGLARTFQNIRLFNELSVIDNVKVAFHMRTGEGLLPTLLNLPRFRRKEHEMTRRALELLELMELMDVKDETAKNLPFGLQRKVEIVRALATEPKLLLLDEPAAGMNIHETEELIHTIGNIHKEYQLTIFLVEHDMKMVMNICERIQVLDGGRVLTMGDPEQIQNDPRVIEAYLGSRRETCDA